MSSPDLPTVDLLLSESWDLDLLLQLEEFLNDRGTSLDDFVIWRTEHGEDLR